MKLFDIQRFTYLCITEQLIPLYEKAFPVLRKSPFGVMTCTVLQCVKGIFMTACRYFRISKSQFGHFGNKYSVICKGGKTKCVKIGNGGNGVSGCVIES